MNPRLTCANKRFRGVLLRPLGHATADEATGEGRCRRNRLGDANGDVWLLVTTIVDDPKYLSQPFYTSTHFKLEPDASRFAPTACATAPVLPVVAKPK